MSTLLVGHAISTRRPDLGKFERARQQVAPLRSFSGFRTRLERYHCSRPTVLACEHARDFRPLTLPSKRQIKLPFADNDVLKIERIFVQLLSGTTRGVHEHEA